jgi:hypothetical protein
MLFVTIQIKCLWVRGSNAALVACVAAPRIAGFRPNKRTLRRRLPRLFIIGLIRRVLGIHSGKYTPRLILRMVYKYKTFSLRILFPHYRFEGQIQQPKNRLPNHPLVLIVCQRRTPSEHSTISLELALTKNVPNLWDSNFSY